MLCILITIPRPVYQINNAKSCWKNNLEFSHNFIVETCRLFHLVFTLDRQTQCFKVPGSLVKGAMSWFRQLETLSLIFSSLLFAICVNLLHP